VSDGHTDSDRLALHAVEDFDRKLAELRAIRDDLDELIGRAHAAVKDLGTVVKDARDAVKRLSADEVRRHLAKESQRIADQLRADMKASRRS